MVSDLQTLAATMPEKGRRVAKDTSATKVESTSSESSSPLTVDTKVQQSAISSSKGIASNSISPSLLVSDNDLEPGMSSKPARMVSESPTVEVLLKVTIHITHNFNSHESTDSKVSSTRDETSMSKLAPGLAPHVTHSHKSSVCSDISSIAKEQANSKKAGHRG